MLAVGIDISKSKSVAAILNQDGSMHTTDAETPQEFAAYVDACKNASLYDTGVPTAYGDKLITLSTCDDSGKNSRVVVVAKRITEPR